ncbi:MAG: hypothetical protein U0324_13900 [Polyangiales bacterium]
MGKDAPRWVLGVTRPRASPWWFDGDDARELLAKDDFDGFVTFDGALDESGRRPSAPRSSPWCGQGGSAHALAGVDALAPDASSPPPRPSSPRWNSTSRRELRLVFEGAGGRADGAYPLHTRGLRKFGAPDLVALCSPGDAELVGDMARQLAHAMARGLDLARPRHALALGDTTTWYAVDDVRGLAGLLGLQNEARVLVDEEGRHLAGVASRIGGEGRA